MSKEIYDGEQVLLITDSQNVAVQYKEQPGLFAHETDALRVDLQVDWANDVVTQVYVNDQLVATVTPVKDNKPSHVEVHS